MNDFTRAIFVLLAVLVQSSVSPAFAAKSPALKPGELVVVTSDGCGIVYKQRGDQYDQYEIKRLKATNWGGVCVDGLAMGRGRLYEAGAMGGGSNPEIFAWAWYGRVFGSFDWKYDDGGANHAFVWDGKVVTYTSLDASRGVWNMGLGKDSVVNDGDKIVITSATPYGVNVINIRPSGYNRYKCPNPESSEGCNALWKQHAGPAINNIKSFIARNTPKVAARRKEAEVLVASYRSRQQSCQKGGASHGCKAGADTAALQESRLKAQEAALARARSQERAVELKREQEREERKKKHEAEMAALRAEQERAARKRKEERKQEWRETMAALKPAVEANGNQDAKDMMALLQAFSGNGSSAGGSTGNRASSGGSAPNSGSTSVGSGYVHVVTDCSLSGFDKAMAGFNEARPLQETWGMRDTYQYSYYYGSEGLKVLAQYKSCMSETDYRAYHDTLVSARDRGLEGCQKLSSDSGASCQPVYPQ